MHIPEPLSASKLGWYFKELVNRLREVFYLYFVSHTLKQVNSPFRLNAS